MVIAYKPEATPSLHKAQLELSLARLLLLPKLLLHIFGIYCCSTGKTSPSAHISHAPTISSFSDSTINLRTQVPEIGT